MYDYADESERGHHSVAMVRLSLDGDGEGIIMQSELEIKPLWEWLVLDEVMDETTWRWDIEVAEVCCLRAGAALLRFEMTWACTKEVERNRIMIYDIRRLGKLKQRDILAGTQSMLEYGIGIFL